LEESNLSANSKEDKGNIEVSSLSNALVVVALGILQVSVPIKKIMIAMKVNIKMTNLKINMETSRKISTRKKSFILHEKGEMYSDNDGMEEGSGEFLFMAQDNYEKNHEAGEKSKKENFDFE